MKRFVWLTFFLILCAATALAQATAPATAHGKA